MKWMSAPTLYISVADQRMTLMQDQHTLFECDISSARNGVGEIQGSECTPRGWHYIRARIGGGCPPNTVFIGRRPSGELYSPALRAQFPQRDWILTRILWLSGLEPGFNRMGEVDTMRRYIYIHGCPDDDQLGRPGSHGCIKVRNQDVINLYDLVPVGTRVLISE